MPPSSKLRRLFQALSVLSAVACVLLIVLWVRSYWFADTFGVSQRWGVSLCRGEFVVIIVEPNSAFFSVVPGYHKEELNDVFDSWNVRNAADVTWNLLLAHGEELSGLHLSPCAQAARRAQRLLALSTSPKLRSLPRPDRLPIDAKVG